MKRQTISVAKAVNIFESSGKQTYLDTYKILRSVFFKLVREVFEASGAYLYELIEDEAMEFTAGIFTVCIEWSNITITNNLSNATCDLMTFMNIGKVALISYKGEY